MFVWQLMHKIWELFTVKNCNFNWQMNEQKKKCSKNKFIPRNLHIAHLPIKRASEKIICILIRFFKYNQCVLFVWINPLGTILLCVLFLPSKKGMSKHLDCVETLLIPTKKKTLKLSPRILHIHWSNKAFVNQSLLLLLTKSSEKKRNVLN